MENSSTSVVPQKNADQKFCFSCGNVLHFSAQSCPKCGAVQISGSQPSVITPTVQSSRAPDQLPANHVFCRGCGAGIHQSARTCPKCGAVQNSVQSSEIGSNSRVAAALLALLLGSFGAHKFYLGKWVQGIIYLLFFWTFIPGIIGFIEGIIYLTMSDNDFNKKYP